MEVARLLEPSLGDYAEQPAMTQLHSFTTHQSKLLIMLSVNHRISSRYKSTEALTIAASTPDF